MPRSRGHRWFVFPVLTLVLGVLPAAPAAAASDSFSGAVDSAGDAWNAHAFEVVAPGPVEATLDWDNASANLNLFLKDPSGTVVAKSLSATARPEVLTHEATVTGTWKVGVKAKTGAAGYTVDVVHSTEAASTIGDFVWEDSDGDGIQDAGEPGAGGVAVHLHDAGSGAEMASASTDGSGRYAFAGLPSGRYYLAVDLPPFREFSLADRGPDDELDSDIDPATGRTVAFALGSGVNDASRDIGLARAPETFAGSVDSAGKARRAHRFDVTAPATIDATLDWDDAGANLDLFLKDPSGTTVAKASSRTAKPEVITHEAGVSGRWKVAIKAKTGAADYTVTVAVTPVTPPPPEAEDWPMFGHDRRHTGVSSEAGLSATNAGSLGIQWQANLGQSSYTSPAVVYHSSLGRRVVYAGNQSGTMSAHDAVTGERIWWYKAPASIQSSPAVDGNVVYFGASDDFLYALNATTGSLICRFFTDGIISSSPVIANPDGTGKVVYFGDNGLTGADDGGHLWAVNAVDPNPAPDCSLRWVFDGFGDPPGSRTESGSWSPPAFGEDGSGRPLIVFGGSSPDNAVYAVDARTGNRVWRYQTEVFHPDNDVGAGATISPPGLNGVADGVAYVPGKNRIVYALNLRTGARIWEFRIRDDSPSAGGATRSTPALVGDRLYVGYGRGVYALDAATGAKVWKTEDVGPSTAEVISSPAVSGPAGARVLFVGDLGGKVYAFRLSDGARLWSYPTGNFIYGSAAVSGGKAFIAGADGFLYSFGVGGGVGERPDTTLVQPPDGSTPPNPSGEFELAGSASDDVRVDRVLVAIKNKNTNKWWDGSSASWEKVFLQNEAALGTPGSRATSWSYGFPMPPEGGVFFAQAEAVDSDGQHDAAVATSNFTVPSLGNPPETDITEPAFAEVFHFPGGERVSFPITVRGTATDTGGANPGIRKVNVVIKNIEQGEYYCGSAGCAAPGGETTEWRPVYTILTATLADPGASSTEWSLTFPTYDHPHKYRLTAWALDNDGEVDQTRAVIGRICVRDVGDNSCV